MNTNLPFSQADLETLRAASSQISNVWDELVEPVKRFGEKYGSAQISECGGFMDRTSEAEAKFRKALVKAGLLQDNSNIQPPMIRQFFLYPYNTLFPPKETKNGKDENDRSQIVSTEPNGQIRDSASLDRDPARNQSNHRDSAQNQRQPQETQSELRTGDLRRNPESDTFMHIVGLFIKDLGKFQVLAPDGAFGLDELDEMYPESEVTAWQPITTVRIS